MTEEALGTIIKAHCGRCGGERNCEVKGFHKDSGSDDGGQFHWNTNWYLLVCCGCEFTFAQTVYTDSESYHDYFDHNDDHVQESIKTVDLWPAKARRQLPDWFDRYRVEGTHLFQKIPLNTAMNELYRALDADLLVLSSIGIRTAFDAASEALGIQPGLPFEDKLTSLTDSGKIRPSERAKLQVLVDAGSAAAHRGWRPDADQISLQMDILEEFIFNSMVLPARQKKREDLVAKLKEAVPPKQVRPNKKKKEGKSAPSPSAPPANDKSEEE